MWEEPVFSIRRAALIVAASAAVVAAFASTAAPASAHERRTVAGKYAFVVGFLNEPALLLQPNGVSLAVTNAQTTEPVEGLEKTLKADIIVGGETKTVDLKARFGQKGAYSADVIPTKTGTWAFRFFGTVEGVQVDERFESGPGRFNDVEDPANLQFPVKAPNNLELAQATNRTGAPAEAGAQTAAPAPDVQKALDRADSARSMALSFGFIGIAIGLVGVGLALWALSSKRGSGDSGSGRPEPV
jgi:hypothetical protein